MSTTTMHCTTGHSTRTPTETVAEYDLTTTGTWSVVILPAEVT